MRNDPCRQCNSVDYYVKGNFSYCRPCHAASQRRYEHRKRIGEELPKPREKNPVVLGESLSLNNGIRKTHCPKGHPYDKSNTRIAYTGKKKERKCKACDRNYRRKTYGLPPEPLPVRLTDIL